MNSKVYNYIKFDEKEINEYAKFNSEKYQYYEVS